MCNTFFVAPVFADMSGIIPLDEEEDEHEQEVYDDVGGEDIYEVLPGLAACLVHSSHAGAVDAWICPTVFQSVVRRNDEEARSNCFLAHSSLSVQRRTCPPWPRLLQKQSRPTSQRLRLQVRSFTNNTTGARRLFLSPALAVLKRAA